MAGGGMARLAAMLGGKGRARAGARFRDLGDKARDRGDWVEAVVNYRRYLEIAPEMFPIWVQLGHVSKESGDPVASEQAYLRALALKPDDADLLLNIGHLMKGQGRFDDALDYYARSAESDPTGHARRELEALGRRPHFDARRPRDADAVPPVAAEAPSPYLAGTIARPEMRREATLVHLMEGGREVARGHARGVGTHQSFRIRLPDDVCDGRVHAFSIMVDGEEVGRSATITPYHLTPASVLQDYASRELRGRLSTAAAWRYAALAAWAESDTTAEDRAAIATAHRFLVDGPARAGLDERYEPLAFPTVEAPTASVIVPVHNKFDYTYRCLASLRLMPNATTFEVVLVDDGSSDRTRDVAALVSGIRVVRHEAAQGFVGACNAGGAAARGEHIVLLNNDTEVSPHWLDRLLEPFALFDDVGLVGAKLIFADGRLQEAGGIVWRDGRAANYGRLGSARDPRFGYLRDTDYCSGACVALPAPLWRELGGFDPAFAPAYYEDTDLAFRVRATGRRVLYQPMSEILHFEGVSNGQDTATGMKRFQAINQPRFLERWGRSLRANGTASDRDPRVIERGYPRQVLVIDSEVPQPDRSAGHHAAVQEIRLLQSLGYRPTFLPQNLAWLGRYNELLNRLGVETIHAPFWLSLEDFISQRGGEFDLIYITRYQVAEAVLPLLRQFIPEAPIVFNNADLHFLRAIRESIDSPEPVRQQEAMVVREAELAVMRAVDLTLSYSDVEHAVIQSHTMGEAKVALCPWVAEPRAGGPGFAEREDIAFLGGYRHPPNVRAVEFFATEVMPLLRRRRPGIRFRIYGSFPPASFARLAGEDVIVEGFVDRVEDALDRARLFVAPLLTGAGLKGKVIEALASGVPAVLSPIAAEGVGVRDGLEAAIARTPQEWAERIAALYDDEAAWAAMARAATSFVAEAYSFDRARAILKRGLNDHGIATLDGPTSRYLPQA